MNKAKTAAIAVLLILCACAHAALAGADCTRPGCLRIELRDELGNAINGAAAQIRLPGNDGILMQGIDLVMTSRDGSRKGPDADGDKAKPDGDVEFDIPAIAKDIAAGTPVMITVLAPEAGLVNWSTTTAYIADAATDIASDNQYMLKISIIDENGKAVPGLTAKFGERTAKDGKDNDADGKTDGAVYFSGGLPAGKSALLIIQPKTGATLVEQPELTIDPAAQTVFTATVKSPHQGD